MGGICPRAPLAVGGEIAVFQLVTVETLVASSVRVLHDVGGEPGKAVHVYLTGATPVTVLTK